MPHHPHRRTLTLGALGLAAAGIGGWAMTDLDTSAAERETAADRLDHLAARWEHISPAQASATALITAQRLAELGDSADTGMLRARALAMYAQAEADRGAGEQAAQIAAAARSTAAMASRAAAPGSDTRLLAIDAQVTAETVEGELYANAAPRGDAAIEILASARRRGGRSAAAARAGALEAYARAVRGDGQDVVIDVLDRAETIIGDTPAPAWPPFGIGHLHAFGGAALVRAGATVHAAEWLAMADEELAAAGQPGIQVANTLYWAHRAAARGEWDGAYSYASGAVAAAAQRGVPAWLVGGVTALARQARHRGGDWSALRAAVAV